MCAKKFRSASNAGGASTADSMGASDAIGSPDGRKSSKSWLNALNKKSAEKNTGGLLQQRELSKKKAKKAKKGGLASLTGLL